MEGAKFLSGKIPPDRAAILFMIRFIDLSNQIEDNTKEFAFYNTVTGKFIEFSDSQTWTSKYDFMIDFDEVNLSRFIDLIPENFFT